MPSYYDYTVPVPAVKNISWKKIKGYVYIYYTYAREKSANGTLSAKNHTIGKLKPGTNPPEMYPNISYYAHFKPDASKAPEIPPPASDLVKDGIETRAKLLLAGLTLLRDSYRDLVQEIRSSGGDPAELDKQIAALIEPEWV